MEKQNRGDSAQKPKRRQLLPLLLLVIGLAFVGYYAYSLMSAPPKPEPLPSSSEVSSLPASSAPPSSSESPSSQSQPSESDPTDAYPEGKLFITAERSAYLSGEMLLSLPRLGLKNVPVLDAVDDVTLQSGLGLYDYSQLPGTGNRNVSIAGHRDVYGKEFYYIDTVTEGDEIYLDYDGKRYTYVFKDAKVVEENDWSPIYIQGFSCLTLTTCTPIGVASHRIIVRAELEKIEELAASSAA